MPKVRLTAADGIGDWVDRKIKRTGQTQTSMAKKLGITQPALSRKIAENKFTYKDLSEIFRETQSTDSEIVKVMRGFI